MPYIANILNSSLSTSDYSFINDLIGQMKTLILQCPLITLISDNEPANNIARTITFAVDTCTRYFRLYASSTTTCRLEVRSLDNTVFVYQTSASYAVQNTIFYVCWGPNTFALRVGGGYASEFVYCKTIIGDWGVMLVQNIQTVGRQWIPPNSNSKLTLTYLSFNTNYDGSQLVSVFRPLSASNLILDEYPIACYYYGALQNTLYNSTSRILKDSNNNYWLYCTNEYNSYSRWFILSKLF